MDDNHIANTIMRYPDAIDMPCEPFGYRTVAWADFALANPDIAEQVAADIAIKGSSRIGGGAAPLIVILRGKI